MSRRRFPQRAVLWKRALLWSTPAVVFLGATSWWFGSARAAFHWMAGRDFVVHVRDRGPGEYELRVQNLRGAPLNVVGIRSNCDCVLIDEPRKQIAPWGTGCWTLRSAKWADGGTRTVTLFTD
ncbi:MAG: hypothetical protein D6725_06805, partial [Planctomycetota bacterium]